VLEGPIALGEALAAGVAVEEVFVEAALLEGAGPAEVIEQARRSGSEVRIVEAGVIARVADAVTPQPVLAICPTVDVDLDALAGSSFVVVCHEIRDPGNLGTLVRSARAAGADGVICTAGSVDIYNPKTVRASAGSMFHVPVVAGGNPLEVLERVGGFGLRRLGATVDGGDDPSTADLRCPLALVLGIEAHGLPELDGHLDGLLTIPMASGTESLNVAMAGTVLCFDVARARRGSPGA